MAMGLLLFAMAASGGCRFTVPLEYRPNSSNSSAGTLVGPTKYYLAAVEDQRNDKIKIGQNKEHSKPVDVVPGEEKSPAQFVHEAFIHGLSQDGLKMVDTADKADRIIVLTMIMNLNLLHAFVDAAL